MRFLCRRVPWLDQRFYASSYGRFNTANTSGANWDVSDPASWNAYSYAEGDPINFFDPSGLAAAPTSGSVTWTGALSQSGQSQVGMTLSAILTSSSPSDFALVADTIFTESNESTTQNGALEMGAIAAVIMNRWQILNGYYWLKNTNGSVIPVIPDCGPANATVAQLLSPNNFAVWKNASTGTLSVNTLINIMNGTVVGNSANNSACNQFLSAANTAYAALFNNAPGVAFSFQSDVSSNRYWFYLAGSPNPVNSNWIATQQVVQSNGKEWIFETHVGPRRQRPPRGAVIRGRGCGVRRAVRVMSLLVFVGASQGASPSGCAPSREAVARLRGYLAYYSVAEGLKPRTQRFDFLSANGREYFRYQDAQPGSDPSARWVYVYQEGANWTVVACPATNTWSSCEVELMAGTPEESGERKIYQQAAARGSCQMSIAVPVWRPSPDTPEKDRMADEILQSLQDLGGVTAVYAKDFNVLDPQIFLMVEDRDHGHQFYACRVNTGSGSRCELGGFGTVSRADLERDISSHAYRIFPSRK